MKNAKKKRKSKIKKICLIIKKPKYAKICNITLQIWFRCNMKQIYFISRWLYLRLLEKNMQMLKVLYPEVITTCLTTYYLYL